jgi:hypothetical protein
MFVSVVICTICAILTRGGSGADYGEKRRMQLSRSTNHIKAGAAGATVVESVKVLYNTAVSAIRIW